MLKYNLRYNLKGERRKMNHITNVFYLSGISGNIWATYENYLKEGCERMNIDITFVDFPLQEKCKYSEWEKAMKEYLKPNTINEHTVIVSRCIGSRFIIKYVADNNIKVKGIISIATSFSNELLVEKEYIKSVLLLFPITEDVISKAIANIEERIFIFGDQDHLFEKEWLEKTAEMMKAEKFFIPGLNHCGNKSEKKEFPELIDAIKKINMTTK